MLKILFPKNVFKNFFANISKQASKKKTYSTLMCLMLLNVMVGVLESILHCEVLQMVIVQWWAHHTLGVCHRLVDQLQIIQFVVGEREWRLCDSAHWFCRIASTTLRTFGHTRGGSSVRRRRVTIGRSVRLNNYRMNRIGGTRVSRLLCLRHGVRV